MNLDNFRFDLDQDGIVTLTWDMAGRSMNVITEAVMGELDAVIDYVAATPDVRGCVVASGKAGFSGGADLAMLRGLRSALERQTASEGAEAATRAFFEASRRLSRLYRKLETSGKPWVAAINGLCLGGAFELALACHRRLMADGDPARVGLPEIKIGLFPGAGGTQRVARLMPTPDALRMMLAGEQIRPAAAKAMGLVHALAPAAELVSRAKDWIRAGGKAVAPWDEKEFRLPSGRIHSPAGQAIWPAANAIYRRETHDNYPAAKALLDAVYEGLQVPFDTGLVIESRLFAGVLRSREAAAMIRTLFVSTTALNKGARRPPKVAPSTVGRLGVVGAGFMGAGIAYVAASAGIPVVLIDRTEEAVQAGRARSHKLASDRIAKGRGTVAERDALLSRIEAATDFHSLAGCDLVIEAVFEDAAVKKGTIARIEAVISAQAIVASNTSTLPITGLAEAAERAERVVGIHFFSPVERMPLVEIVRGSRTGDRAIAVAFDFVRALRKTPIVVEDAPGFFANRCVGAYLLEGLAMLLEGVPPAMIENLARQAGMPVGPLSLADEVALDLVRTVVSVGDAAVGGAGPGQRRLLDELVVERNRLGRKNGRGFYDYPERGGKRFWPGLAELLPRALDPDAIDRGEIKTRLLAVQALAAADAHLQGIVRDPREADVGSVLGFGFAPFTGGVLSYIEGIGLPRFVILCDDFAKRHGARFAPPPALVDGAKGGGAFYGHDAGA